MGGGIGSRGVARLALAGLALLSSMSGGCASGNDVLDLRVNDQLYRAPRYRARLPVDRAVFVVPRFVQKMECSTWEERWWLSLRLQ